MLLGRAKYVIFAIPLIRALKVERASVALTFIGVIYDRQGASLQSPVRFFLADSNLTWGQLEAAFE